MQGWVEVNLRLLIFKVRAKDTKISKKNPGAPATVDENKDKAFRPVRMRQKDSQIDI